MSASVEFAISINKCCRHCCESSVFYIKGYSLMQKSSSIADKQIEKGFKKKEKTIIRSNGEQMEIVGKYNFMERIESWKGKKCGASWLWPLHVQTQLLFDVKISTALIYLFGFYQILCIFALFGVYFVTNFLFLSKISGLY